MQGGVARLRPRFSLLMTGILLSLANPAWAGGNLAEWAEQLGSNDRTPNFSSTKDSLRRADCRLLGIFGTILVQELGSPFNREVHSMARAYFRSDSEGLNQHGSFSNGSLCQFSA